MKKIIFTFLSFIISLATVSAQKGIDFNKTYAAGGKLLMSVDSGAKNVNYANLFPNQPNTSFNYLTDVNNVSIQINFRKNIKIEYYRYTILVDDKPIAVNTPINKTQLKDTNAGGDEELFSSTILGTFYVKGKVITTLVYSIENPLAVDKAIFYGKQIPRSKVKSFSKLFATEKGFDYSWVKNPKEKTDFTFFEEDLELTIVKEKSAIDYLYFTSIKDKETNKIIFESTSWQYGGIVEEHEFLPYVKIGKNVFKKSGEYEIIIQPLIKWTNCFDCNISAKEIEKYTTTHTLSITLDEDRFTQRQMAIFGLLTAFAFLAILVATITFIKRKAAKKLAINYKQKEIAKFQLNAVRSQLNPHFMFNALSGIQNLMNKNEIDNANKYLSKFARLTRNVLNDKELINLSQERTLLDDYLQMEQLRFGFKYEISFSENLDLDNIELPSMLLQPFVENAVKHGISQKADDGKIVIAFMKQTNDLVLIVTDNGNGFDTKKQSSGLGLALSNNRIALLNSIYKENRFILAMQATADGTKVSLTLTDWL